MRVYIAGKFTCPNPEDQAECIALAAEHGKAIRELGHEAFVPHTDIGNPEPGTHPADAWNWAMRRCLAALVGCEAVVLVPNWVESRGARLERYVAERTGIPVFESLGHFILETA